jgi:poly(hydroxyalkanoate) depolymerase family esterase
MHIVIKRMLMCAASIVGAGRIRRVPGDHRQQARHLPTTRQACRMPGAIAWAAPAMLLAAVLGGCGNSSAPSYPQGETVEITYSNGAGNYRALVYVPASYNPKVPAPVVVNIHGCAQTAELQQAGTLFDRIADREGVIVVYPDFVDQQTHPLICWRFYLPTEWGRGQGDASGVVGLTRQVMETWAVDPERVYVLGGSSGAFLTSILGAAYPDLYAAIGIMAGGPYASTFLDAANPVIPSLENQRIQARLAFWAMGEHARVVPMLELHGDIDTTIYPENGVNAVQQWLMTNNLVAAGTLTGPFPLSPSETKAYGAGSDFPYEIDDYRDPDGCLAVRHVRIHGLAHLWPGGSDDPSLPAFVAPTAPSASEMVWDFFSRYRKSSTALPCVED